MSISFGGSYGMHNALKSIMKSIKRWWKFKNAISWSPSPKVAQSIDRYRKEGGNPKKIVIFTCIVGGYDQLMVPDILDSEIDYVCFTDRAINSYGVWQIRAIPYYHPDPTRIARYVKLHPHTLLPGYETAIWMDANVTLRGDIRPYIAALKESGKSIGLIPHPQRDCTFDEGAICLRKGLDEEALIRRQMDRYRQCALPTHIGLYETNVIIALIEAPSVKGFFQSWWQELKNYSKRDQLSVVFALRENGIDPYLLFPNKQSARNHPDFSYFIHSNRRKGFFGLKDPASLKAYRKVVDPLVDQSSEKSFPKRSSSSVDIIVCVYNALADTRACLESLVLHREDHHEIIIVNDKSDEATSAFLRQFTATNDRVRLLENEINCGYVRSANRGLKAGTAEFRIVLNSDTVVTKGWAGKMHAVALSNKYIGIVGPLSNAASWQSIPHIKGEAGQTAINELPLGIGPDEMNEFCESRSLKTFPYVPLIHGFCYGVKVTVLEKIGYFDEVEFAKYYGEEDDFSIRAGRAGFELAVATDTYILHKKSKSIPTAERLIWMEKARETLRRLHGKDAIKLACHQMKAHPLLARMRRLAYKYYENSDR